MASPPVHSRDNETCCGSTIQIYSTPDTKQKTGNETTTRTTLELDRRGSTETTWEEEEEDAVTGSACLNTTDTKVPVRNLCSFSIQCKPVFPVDAVRFLTIKGNTICSDPSSSWAVKAVKYLDENMKPQSASSTDHQFVTTAPKNTSTTNAKSAQSSTIQICSPPENYTQSLRDIKHRTENKTEFPNTRTTLEPDWRGSTETTETFQLEEEESNIMNEPFTDRFCLKAEQVKYSDP
ncbi:uncharacterized protein [Chanodichthys erythropterus]|uniref:uncharacterized protein n=1 Tax=Chanodichthys erythropterus TaxID=933992 RepID=UPI00351E6F47